MTAIEEKLSASSRAIPEALPHMEKVTRPTFTPHIEGIQHIDTLPLATFGGLTDVEEQVRARLTERLTGASVVYLPTTDED